MIRTIIVDDSRVAQEFIAHLLSSDPDIQIIGIANSGEEAIRLITEFRPDVVTMDIHMPGLDGYEATRIIMETVPTPIVIVSASAGVTHAINSFRLFEAGALAVVLRPPSMDDPGFAGARKTLVQTVKLMSEIKVVKRFPNQLKERIPLPVFSAAEPSSSLDIKLIAIGASTGGPLVLKTILSGLPKNLPVPVLIVQHISKGFVKGFVDWLSDSSAIPLHLAQNGDFLIPGHGYIAPDDYQMGVSPGIKISLKKSQPENGLCPSVDYLFRSVAEVAGPGAIGVLLSGMGRDGARELKTMKTKGAFTIVQDEASCVVFGMPGEAVKIGAADKILSPGRIVEKLSELCKNNHAAQ
jgi:two-component system chemotaxis response regulator CheB